jgi:hypothetical protein
MFKGALVACGPCTGGEGACCVTEETRDPKGKARPCDVSEKRGGSFVELLRLRLCVISQGREQAKIEMRKGLVNCESKFESWQKT